MPVFLRFLCILAFSITAGCSVRTMQPLSNPLSELPNEALYGQWLSVGKNAANESEETRLFITRHKSAENPSSIMEYLIVSRNLTKNTLVASVSGYFTTSRVGDHLYINGLYRSGGENHELSNKWRYAEWSNDPGRRVLVYAYAVSGKQLSVWLAATVDRKIDELIASGELSATARAANSGESILLTQESLVRYLQKSGPKALFTSSAVFMKVP